MRDELLPYYEQELTFIRQMAAEFADKYPKVAGRLLLEPDRSEDPHVERLIESFALLCGRVRHKIDDEFPEITEALLDTLYPHYLRPVPSLAITQFDVHASQNVFTTPAHVPVGTVVRSKPENGQVCSFRTCYPVTLWPLGVRSASVSPINRFASLGMPVGAAAVLRIEMECLAGTRLAQLPLDSIRFYLQGEGPAVHTLYEFLFLNTLYLSLRALPSKDSAESIVLPATSLRQVGFTSAEGILPYSDRSFLGYRLLQEYFVFPEKYLFFELAGLGRAAKKGFGSAFEILIYLKQPSQQHRLVALEQAVDAGYFQLGCTPVVNLFELTAEPIRLTQTKTEYRVIPDQHRQLSTEVYSIDRVVSTAPYLQEARTYYPFYDLRHRQQDEPRHFWHAHRRPPFRKNDSGTEVYLSLVDLDLNPALSPSEVLTVHVTCTNRDQAAQLKLSGEFGELDVEDVALVRARCIRKPTRPARPPLRRSLHWRLISHLSLNHLSIAPKRMKVPADRRSPTAASGGAEEKGAEALQEILRLYDFSDDEAVQKQIDGIVNVTSRPCMSRVKSEIGVVYCRGTDVTIEFDEEHYVGTGFFLLSSVLYRFLGLYSAVNSFSRLKVTTKKGVLKQWPPLAGEQVLL